MAQTALRCNGSSDSGAGAARGRACRARSHWRESLAREALSSCPGAQRSNGSNSRVRGTAGRSGGGRTDEWEMCPPPTPTLLPTTHPTVLRAEWGVGDVRPMCTARGRDARPIIAGREGGKGIKRHLPHERKVPRRHLRAGAWSHYRLLGAIKGGARAHARRRRLEPSQVARRLRRRLRKRPAPLGGGAGWAAGGALTKF